MLPRLAAWSYRREPAYIRIHIHIHIQSRAHNGMLNPGVYLASTQQAFPQQVAQLPGLGFPICRIVGITCLSSG